MKHGFLRLAVLPWPVRLVLLLLLASPALAGSSIHRQVHADHFFVDLLGWTEYAVMVWLFIAVAAGFSKLSDWLSVATLMALSIAATGALTRIASGHLLGTSDAEMELQMMSLTRTFVLMLVVYPLALLILTSFPAADLIRWVSARSAKIPAGIEHLGTSTYALIVLALFLRMFQHVGEVVEHCLIAWREENPLLLLPRHRTDWAGSVQGRLGILDFLKMSVAAWILAITYHSFVVLPTIITDFRRITGGRVV